MSAAPCESPRRRVTVVVLGDLARSPRMMRHAECLVAAGMAVDVVAYLDEVDAPPESPPFEVHRLAAPRPGRNGWIAAAARVVGDMRGVAAVVLRRRPSWVLVQNPPAMHVLPVLLAVCRWRGCRLFIDWHNFGWTMLGLRLGDDSRLVAAAGWLERTMARRADAHLCVSAAMRRSLAETARIDASVFRDLPGRGFVDAARCDDRIELRRRLLPQIALPPTAAAELLDGRAMLLVSATSWSADEDFTLLVDALRLWAVSAARGARPHLVVVVSGRGPLREYYERELSATELPGVTFRAVWLSPSDYPRLLAAADLGVCLHRSSSGVDLPMKLADMQGAGLPACVLDYGPCLSEVVRDGDDAFLFETAAELAAIWDRVFVERPDVLAAARQRLRVDHPTWQEHWNECVAPLFLGDAAAIRGCEDSSP